MNLLDSFSSRVTSSGTLLQVKGLSREELALRPDQVKALAARIDAVPDGVTLNNRRAQRGGPGSHREIKIDAVNPGTTQLPSAVWLVFTARTCHQPVSSPLDWHLRDKTSFDWSYCKAEHA
jgi:hypothetical protein